MKRKTSPIWNYFVVVDESNARCKVCDKVYSRKGRTTTALKSHLKSLHIEIFEEFVKLDQSIKQSSKEKNPKIDELQEQNSGDVGYNNCLETKIKQISHIAKRTLLSLSNAKKKKTQEVIHVVNRDTATARKRKVKERDESDIFGESVAIQLKKLSEENALKAKCKIQTILTEYGIADLKERKRTLPKSKTSASPCDVYSQDSNSNYGSISSINDPIELFRTVKVQAESDEESDKNNESNDNKDNLAATIAKKFG